MLEGIILAGGFGTRLREIVDDVPKPMAPINGTPFLEILLSSLSKKNFSRVILSVGFMSDKIINYFGNRFRNLDIVYVVEKSPLGTGGAIRLALEESYQDHVYIFNGDTYLDLEVSEIEKLWHSNLNPIIVGRQVADTGRYGRLIVTKSAVTGFEEKGVTGVGLINAGCYILNKGQLEDYSLLFPFSFERDYLSEAVKTASFDLFETSGDFIDIGIPEDYIKAQTKLAGK